MSEIRSVLAEMRAKRWHEDMHLAKWTTADLEAITSFTLEQMITRQPGEIGGVPVRFIFFRRTDHLEEHAVQIAGFLRERFELPVTQAHLYWEANQQARGDLYASLCGVTDEHLNDVPDEPEGEWSIRQILEHLIGSERAYATRAAYAVERWHAGKPYDGHPVLESGRRDWSGATLLDLITELDRAREESLQTLIDLKDDELRAPMLWAGMDIDVRFQLMRFAHHEREHAAQIRKCRIQCGNAPGESADLLGTTWQAHSRLEGILAGVPDSVLDRDPGDEEWTIRRILEHISSGETYFARVIDSALH
ncbi:MAG: DinB family protein [Chloroflexota bacterium]